MRINVVALQALLFLGLISPSALGQGNSPELWYWQHAYPESPADVTAIENQIDKAFSYGYTGVAFWSSAFTFMGASVHPANNVAYMQQLISYAQAKGMKTMGGVAPYGYSDDALIDNPNWAEGEQLIGSQFTVNSSKTALVPVNSFGGLTNPGFESGMTGWFDFNDPNMGIDTSVTHSGTGAGYITNAPGNARFKQTINVIPWRQYHARIWVKTTNFAGYAQIEVWDPSTNTTCFGTPITQQSTQDWTALDFTFNSRGTSQPLFLFGVWGGSSGTIRFDDIFVEETSLVYVLRRPGTPLTAYNPANPNAVYQEGIDFNTITDPQLAAGGLFNGFYHTPGTITLPATTSLQPGQTVAINYYAAQPVQPIGDVGMCLTETGAQNWLRNNAQSIVSNMPAGMNYLLSYDEMRHMDSCSACKAKNMTPGQLLGWHVGQTYNLYQSLAPSAQMYVWSDMFDPYHNAVSNYFFVEGNIAGSWTGLPSKLTIMNWNLGNLTNSLTWFSGRNPQQPTPFRQIIAGYYDSGDGTASATQEVSAALGIPGLTGFMYTTWGEDYSQMQNFATAIKSRWSSYVASLVTNVSGSVKVTQTGFARNRATGLWVANLIVKNTSGSAIAGPIEVVLTSLTSGVAMTNSTGTYGGSPYITVSAGPLAPGASVSVSIQFTNPSNGYIGYTPITYSGGL